MILEGDFYTVSGPVTDDGSIQVMLTINPHHDIFRGHFPEQPVVPGVCMLQIVKELLQKSLGKPVRLQTGHDLKFLAVIDPGRNNTVQAELYYTVHTAGDIHVTARLFYTDLTFFKFKGIFTAS